MEFSLDDTNTTVDELFSLLHFLRFAVDLLYKILTDMFCAESSVVVFLSLLRFRLVILLFYVFIVYLYPSAVRCAY